MPWNNSDSSYPAIEEEYASRTWPEWKQEINDGVMLSHLGFYPADGDRSLYVRKQDGLTCYITMPKGAVGGKIHVALKYTDFRVKRSYMDMTADLWQTIRRGASNALLMDIMMEDSE